MSEIESFLRYMARIAVAQICEDSKFHTIQESALDALTDVMVRYIEQIGALARKYAEHASRTEPNFHDTLLAFQDLGINMDELQNYVQCVPELPFVRTIPVIPITATTALPDPESDSEPPAPSSVSAPRFRDLGEVPPHPNIPDWLPAFPDAHTYAATTVWPERSSSPRTEQMEVNKERRKSEKSLASLHQRLNMVTAGGGLGQGDVVHVMDTSGKGKKRYFWGQHGQSNSQSRLRSRTEETDIIHVNGDNGSRVTELVPLTDIGYLGEAKTTSDELDEHEDSLNAMNVFSTLVQAGKSGKHQQEQILQDGEDIVEEGATESAHGLGSWTGWSRVAATVRDTQSVMDDWSNNVKQKGSEARQLFAVGARGKRGWGSGGFHMKINGKKPAGENTVNDDEKEERRKRVVQILEKAQRGDKERLDEKED